MLTFPLINDTSHKIIHIDMDAFFASVEQRDNPELRGKPVVIARNPLETGGRGVVSTCSYEAREFGVHSAMSAKEAYELCPQAIFVAGNYEKYTEVSRQVRQIFSRYTDKVEAASVDEAYLDVTYNKLQSNSAVKIAKLIQYDIFKELQLSCSAGISYNKFLAKIASDWKKPHGLTLIKPEEAKSFLAKLSVSKFHGVGKATVAKLEELGIQTGKDLQETNPILLAERLGVNGWQLYLKANGIHTSRVISSRERKSIGKERTFSKLINPEGDAVLELEKISARVADALKEKKKKGNVVIVKVRYEDFTTFTKRRMSPIKFDEAETLLKFAREIYEGIEHDNRRVRLLGVTVSGFEPEQALLDNQW